jgi:hypothetical protein
VEFACSRPGSGKPKKIYSWALYSSRRSRARAQMNRGLFSGRGQRAVSARAPLEAAELARQQPSQLMTIELSRRATEAGQAGPPGPAGPESQAGGELRSVIAWRPVAAIVVPALALLIVFLIR